MIKVDKPIGNVFFQLQKKKKALEQCIDELKLVNGMKRKSLQ